MRCAFLCVFQGNLAVVAFNVERKNDSYWTSRKNSLELLELSSRNKVSLV